MRRRHALVGLLAALSVLSSFVLVAADIYPEFGTLFQSNGHSNNHWIYAYDKVAKPEEIVQIVFRYRLDDGTDNSVPIKRKVIDYEAGTVDIFLWSRYIPQESADTYVVVEFSDGEVYMATGPGFAWRKRG